MKVSTGSTIEKQLPIFLLKFCLLVLVGIFLLVVLATESEANPVYVPDREAPHAGNAGGGPAPVEGNPIRCVSERYNDDILLLDENARPVRFVSENVTVYLDEHARIEANYTFFNPYNETLDRPILLPFHYSSGKPTDLNISDGENTISYTWETHNLEEWFWYEDDFGSEYYYDNDGYYDPSYPSANFSVHFEPFENVTISVNYNREYTLNSYWLYGDEYAHQGSYEYLHRSSGKRFFNNYIYLTRTGALWEEPIVYAKFDFYVSNSICGGNFNDGEHYRNYYENLLNGYYNSYENDNTDYDLPEVVYHTEYLTDVSDTDDSYFLLRIEYFNWTPEKDIGVTWISGNPRASMEMSLKTDSHYVTVLLDSSSSQSYGYIENYTWKLDSSNIGYSKSTSLVLAEKGEYDISLKVVNNFGLEGTVKERIIVTSTLDTLVFKLSEETENPSDFSCYWRFDDGNRSREDVVEHRYANPGIYDVSLSASADYYWRADSFYVYYKVVVLSFDTDGDGFQDGFDAIPDDPAASIDTDGDGYPDSWNKGMNEYNSTKGLYLDDFPDDPAASFDLDGDGHPDWWNQGMDRDDSTTGLKLDHYPDAPSRWEKKSSGFNLNDFTRSDTMLFSSSGLLIVLLVSFALMISRRSGEGFPQEKAREYVMEDWIEDKNTEPEEKCPLCESSVAFSESFNVYLCRNCESYFEDLQ